MFRARDCRLTKQIEVELVWRRPWKTRRQAEIAAFEYIKGFNNPRRRHSAGKALLLRMKRGLNDDRGRHKTRLIN
ncbi:IS3 family transposase [Sulfitobacter sp.]|uniref:IS3 family transposase n=1 Tax=Sulfitobacter sp. TaxID=1903071 RepID=UPI003FCE6981